jgi:DNA-binding transcriptional ArsR family regulator
MVQYAKHLDTSLAAIADPTRRGILERLGRGEASITDLAARFDMTLTGLKKHVQILEGAGLVKSQKVGRVRTCRLGDRRLDDAADWIAKWQRSTNERYDRLEALLERTNA